VEEHVSDQVTLHQVTGGNGVHLAVRTAGPAGAPAIVLVHGWCQSSAAWSAQLADPLLTDRYRLAAVDLRGHGASDVPDTAGGYDDPEAWADDIAAVLDLVGRPAILVGWSYGGAVICDYLRAFGDVDLAGIVFVGASVEVGRDRPGAQVGTAMQAVVPYVWMADLDVATRGFTEFVRGMSETHLPGAVSQRIVGDALRVPWEVRKAVLRRDFDSSGVLQMITVPTLVAHGRLDAVIDPSVAEYSHGKIPGAELRWFEKVGHMPFAERTEEFDEMLLGFANEAFAHKEDAE
jgi:non-heme chloroperoxidase